VRGDWSPGECRAERGEQGLRSRHARSTWEASYSNSDKVNDDELDLGRREGLAVRSEERREFSRNRNIWFRLSHPARLNPSPANLEVRGEVIFVVFAINSEQALISDIDTPPSLPLDILHIALSIHSWGYGGAVT
jgi:hypothetical protein